MSPQWMLFAEIAGTFFGLASVYLLTIGNGRGWSLGMIWIVLTGLVFFSKGYYGSTCLQLFFLVTQVIGWRRWHQGEKEDLRSSALKLEAAQMGGLCLALGLLTALGAKVLTQADGQAPWLDAFATAGSVVAQLLMVRGYLECWLVWLAVDVVYLYLTALVGLKAFLFLYLVFCGLALNGWWHWTRDVQE